METWVLIIWMTAYGQRAVSVTNIPGYDKTGCEQAATAARSSQYSSYSERDRVQAFCIPGPRR